jgi:hypothetical protein
MKSLTTTECDDYSQRIGPKNDLLDRRKLGTMKRIIDFTYRSRLENGRPVATEIASCLGNFASALLWTHGLALQLRFLRVSESMGNHDSKIVDAGGVD